MPDLNKIEIGADEVVEAWGDYYLDHGQNMNNLHMLPFEESDTQTSGTILPTEETVIREANVEFQEVLQQYQDDFTNKGGVDFLPVNIFLQRLKIDTGVIPQKLVGTWLGFLTDSGNDPLTYPFVKWLPEKYLLKQAKEDFELKSVYSGVYEAPVEGTAGSASKVIDGIEVLQNRFVNNNLLDPIETGDLAAVSASAMVTAIENFIKSIPEKYRYNYLMELNLSRTFRDKFKQGMRDKYNVNYQQTDQLLRVMDFENVTIVGRASMAGKKRIWCTPKFNALFPVKGFSNKNGFDVQKQDRKVKFLTDWWQGVGFIQPEILFMNSAEVPEPVS